MTMSFTSMFKIRELGQVRQSAIGWQSCCMGHYYIFQHKQVWEVGLHASANGWNCTELGQVRQSASQGWPKSQAAVLVEFAEEPSIGDILELIDTVEMVAAVPLFAGQSHHNAESTYLQAKI